MSFPSDLEIARSVTPRPIADIAHDLGIARRRARAVRADQGQGHPRGDPRLEAERPRGKYVVVTAITPTPLGEGKSTTTVGLAQGLNHIGAGGGPSASRRSGPVFGIKGGAAGGGYSQVIPMEDFNLHLTGDVHAIGAAHNLAGAFLDNASTTRTRSASTRTGSSGRASSTSATAPCATSSSASAGARTASRARPSGHHRRLGGDGRPRARHRPARPARPARGSCGHDQRRPGRSRPRTSASPGP